MKKKPIPRVIVGFGVCDTEGKLSYGVHGYRYREATEKPARGEAGYLCTNRGYLKKKQCDELDEVELVAPESCIEIMSNDIPGNPSKEVQAFFAFHSFIDSSSLFLTTSDRKSKLTLFIDDPYLYEVATEIDRMHAANYIGSRGIYPHRDKLQKFHKAWVEEGKGRHIEIIRTVVRDDTKAMTGLEKIWATATHPMNNRATNLAAMGSNLPPKTTVTHKYKPDTFYNTSDHMTKSPLVGYSDIPIIINTTDEVIMMANVKKSLTEIGKRTPTVSYGVLRDKETRIQIKRILTVIKGKNDTNTPISIKVRSLFNKGFVRDFHLYGDLAMTPSPSGDWSIAVTGQPLAIIGHPVNMILHGMMEIDALQAIVMDKKSPSHISDIREVDITPHLYDTNDKGTMTPTDLLKKATKAIRLPHPTRKKATKLYQLGDNLPDRASMVRLARLKPTITLYAYKEDSNEPHKYAIIITAGESMAVYQNVVTSYLF